MTYAQDTGSIATPIGRIGVAADGATITRISVGDDPGGSGSETVAGALDQLAAYFAGDRCDFDLTLALAATARGQVLRAAIVAIGYGDTASYGELARRYGSGSRAIGQACARNLFPIVVPCHRVLAASGLGNYSAGDGLATKQWLLAHERCRVRTT